MINQAFLAYLISIKIQKIQTPEESAVIILTFEQHGFTNE